MSITGSPREPVATPLLQFNATIIVGIFLFLTLGATGIVALLIVTTLFPFLISATVLLVWRVRFTGRDEIGNPKYASNLPAACWLTVIGTGWLVAVLIYFLVIYPEVFESIATNATIVINGNVTS
jgi:heme/copper-type cytochrome/quinol oxidase subunit 2